MQSDHEIYPMPLFPRLVVSDLAESTRWYEALGFDVVYSMPTMAHVRYRKYADVLLATAAANSSGDVPQPGERRGRGVSIYVTVESESVEDVAERARSHGIEVGDGPRVTPWNTRELALADPDGYELAFSEGPLDETKSFEEAVGAVDRDAGGAADPDDAGTKPDPS